MSQPDVSTTTGETNLALVDEVDTPTSVRRTKRRSSIAAKIVARILPLIVLPLLAISILSILAITLIQDRTDDAIQAAEELLTTEVVEDGVNRSAERVSREVNELINDMTEDVENLSKRREVGISISDGNARLEELRTNGEFDSAAQLRAALSSTPVLVGRSFVDGLANDLAIGESVPEVSLVSIRGVQLANTSGTPATLYRDTEWFQSVMESESGLWLDPFVIDDSGRESFEIIKRATAFSDSNVVGIVRVRIPIVAFQDLLDKIISDSGAEVEIALLDRTRGMVLADTSTDHDPRLLYDSELGLDGSESVNAELMEPGTLQDESFVTAATSVSARGGAAETFDWLVQVRQPLDAATASLAQVRQVSDDVASTQSLVSFGMLSLTVVALYVGWRATTRIARRITDPVRYLSSQAQRAATEGIPLIVAAAEHSKETLPELEPFTVDTDDELAVLADSLNVMQSAAVGLAAGQAKLRRQNVARTFVSLGRRNQNLLNRQLEFIDDLERSETDPDTLENLFRLDHLATRMRRNAENLLVLAGEQTPRRWGKPIALRDVLQAAASEIGDFKRVRIGDIDDATVSGSVATDISHLVAELLENAATFSPPTTPIDIVGQRTPTHYRLAIMDQGIGMDEGALAQANHRLANPVDFADAPSAYIGLFVVGHVARQLDVRVRLAKSEPVNLGDYSSPATGTIAFIDLPNSLLTAEAPTTIDLPARTQQRALPGPAEPPPTLPTTTSDPLYEPVPDPLEVLDPNSAGSKTPAVTDWNKPTTVPVPVDAPPAEPEIEVTAAGFPKRNRGASPEPQAPTPHNSPPAATPAPAAFPTAPAAASTASVGSPGLTAAGFPKRSRSGESERVAVPEASGTEPRAATPPIARDPRAVSNSLLSFKQAVARGREDVAPARSVPPGTPGQGAPAANARPAAQSQPQRRPANQQPGPQQQPPTPQPLHRPQQPPTPQPPVRQPQAQVRAPAMPSVDAPSGPPGDTLPSPRIASPRAPAQAEHVEDDEKTGELPRVAAERSPAQPTGTMP